MLIVIRILSAAVVAGAVVLGVWITGGVITDDFDRAMLLSGVWLGCAGVVCLAVGWRVAPLRWPVIGAYAATAAILGAWLAAGTLRDRVVDETVAKGVAASDLAADTDDPSAETNATRDDATANIELAAGTFTSGEHTTTGRAAIVRLANGRRVLTLTGFVTSAGPDLRVRLVPGDTRNGAAPGNVDLGALKGNRGDQQYALPAAARARGSSVVIWCRAFSAEFGTARLRAS